MWSKSHTSKALAFWRSSTRFSLLDNARTILLLRHFYETVERMSERYLERRKKYVHFFCFLGGGGGGLWVFFELEPALEVTPPPLSSSRSFATCNTFQPHKWPISHHVLCFYRLLLKIDQPWPMSTRFRFWSDRPLMFTSCHLFLIQRVTLFIIILLLYPLVTQKNGPFVVGGFAF